MSLDNPVADFEREWERWCGWPYEGGVVACSSGTAALHLALEALQFPRCSEVILPDFTMVACARAVVLAGLKPVFVDCGSDLLIRPDLIEEAISDKTVAIMPVHIYGRVCDRAAIYGIAENQGLKIIEDWAEAHGAEDWKTGHKLVPDAACWSFYRNKIVAGEEGGAVAFKKDPHLTIDVARVARQLRSLGFTQAHDFMHLPRGHNYRMSRLHVSAVLESLHNYQAEVRCRRLMEARYNQFVPADCRMPERDAPWVYDLRVPVTRRRALAGALTVIVKAVQERWGVAARHGFKPMSSQYEFIDCRTVRRPGSEWGWVSEAREQSSKVMYLPLLPEIEEGKVQEILDYVLSP